MNDGEILKPGEADPFSNSKDAEAMRVAAATLANKLNEACAGADSNEVLYAMVILFANYLATLPDAEAVECCGDDFYQATQNHLDFIRMARKIKAATGGQADA